MISIVIGLYRRLSRRLGGKCCRQGWSKWGCEHEEVDMPVFDEYSNVVDYVTKTTLFQSRQCLGCGYTQKIEIESTTAISEDRKCELGISRDLEVDAQRLGEFLEDLLEEIVDSPETLERIANTDDDERIFVSIPARHIKFIASFCDALDDDDDYEDPEEDDKPW